MEKIIKKVEIKKKVLCALCFSVSLLSCKKEIQYKGEGKDPVLVLNGLVENDSTFKVYLEKSSFFISNDPEENNFIKTGANLKLTNVSSGEVFTMNQSTVDNVYEFPFVTPPNTKFKIEVSYPNYPSISSEMTSVSKVDLINVDTSSYSTTKGLMKKAVLKWNDPIGENYYMVKVINTQAQSSSSYDEYFTSKDQSITDNVNLDGSENYYQEIYLTDELFEGKLKQLEVNFMTFNLNPPLKYTYKLITISKEIYLYGVAIRKNANVDGVLTGEPVKVYSNISEGLGIFGSMSLSEIIK